MNERSVCVCVVVYKRTALIMSRTIREMREADKSVLRSLALLNGIRGGSVKQNSHSNHACLVMMHFLSIIGIDLWLYSSIRSFPVENEVL